MENTSRESFSLVSASSSQKHLWSTIYALKSKYNLSESGGNRKVHASLVKVLTEKIPTYNSIVRGDDLQCNI